MRSGEQDLRAKGLMKVIDQIAEEQWLEELAAIGAVNIAYENGDFARDGVAETRLRLLENYPAIGTMPIMFAIDDLRKKHLL